MATSLTDNLIGMGLVEARGETMEESIYVLHPGVAEAGRKDTNPELAIAVDKAMRQFWWFALVSLLNEQVERTELVIDSAQRGAPYLMRRQLWEEAVGMLEQVVLRFPSPAVLDQTIPLLRKIVAASDDTPKGIESAGVLAMALSAAGKLDEAEELQRQIIEDAVATENYRIAVSTAADLCYLLELSGRFTEALEVAEQMLEYTQRGKLDTWVELMSERMRLQILCNMKFSDKNLIEQLGALYDRMATTPDDEEKQSIVRPYHEREMTLRLMGNVAVRLEDWQTGLELMTLVANSKQARGASPLETAQPLTTIADCLIQLHKYDEAKEMLLYCKSIFEQAKSLQDLSMTFNALGTLEFLLEHWAQANTHKENALRYTYLLGNPQLIANGHFNLALTLNRVEPESPKAIAHRLAACIIDLQISSGGLELSISRLVKDMRGFATQAASAPASFDSLCEMVEETEGVRFRELFDELPTRYSTGDEAQAEVLRLAQIKCADKTLEGSAL
jgi:tetratricopeptide (TPR) repeat protein